MEAAYQPVDKRFEAYESYGVLGRGLYLLEMFSGTESLSITEISRLTGINKATVFRTVNTLKSLGYLRQDPRNQRYSMSTKVLQLAAKLINGMNIRHAALPFMRKLVELTGETVNLFILDGSSAVCIEQVPGTQSMRLLTEVGSRTPLHCGASPKLLLAMLPEETAKRMIDEAIANGGLPKYTLDTPTDREQLLAIIAKIRRQGYCVSRGEVDLGAVGIACPVYDLYGKVIASLSLSGPAIRITEAREPEYIRTVQQIAKELSAELGYTD